MNHKLWIFKLAFLVLVLLAACRAPEPSPTPPPPPSPTPVKTSATITFSGDTCTYDGPDRVPSGKMVIDWVVKEPDRDKYALVVLTLTEGKTFEDIDQWPSADPPPWINIVGFGEAAPNSQSQLTAHISGGPIYFVCFYSPPDTKFDTLGPVAVANGSETLPPLPTITPHAAPIVAENPRSVIIDTDMGADDWMAILYLLQRADLSIQAITVSGTGVTHCNVGVLNVLRLVELANHPVIPVACGRETPLAGNHSFPEDWRKAADDMMGAELPQPKEINPASEKAALELLANTLQASSGRVTLLTLGPLTNIADLLEQQPTLTEKIEAVYLMGGAVNVPGNLGVNIKENKSAEYNIYIDPVAANISFKSGLPFTMVPLDATNQVPITPEFYRQLQASLLTPEARWIYALFNREQGYFQSGSTFFWDPLAAAILTDESLATYETYPVCVVEEEGSQSGQTIVKTGCPKLRVAVTSDARRFEKIFLDTLNNP